MGWFVYMQVLKNCENATVLCCAPSNFATDLLVSGLRQYSCTPSQVLRLNDPRRLGGLDSVKPDVRDYCMWNDDLALFELPENTSSYQVIACTCASAIALLNERVERASRGFTHVFIDEAGQALLSESLIPILAGVKDDSNLLLAGDPKQLGPVVHSDIARKHGFGITLIQALMECECLPCESLLCCNCFVDK